MAEDIWFSARDGVRLYARRHGQGKGLRRPVICLPGLTGNSSHFDLIADQLADADADRRDVFALDMRGRGRSGPLRRDPTSPLLVECQDALDFMTLRGLGDAVVLGTGHGGQVAMLMALLRPSAVGTVILNDAGPEFESEGIAQLVGEMSGSPLPLSFADAAVMMRRLHRGKYPRLAEADWMSMARAQYPEANGRPQRSFDPGLARAYSLTLGRNARVTLWDPFTALCTIPVLLVRGHAATKKPADLAAPMKASAA